ncbi:hypothetical protein D3C76_1569970 [compost metagenome]
MTAELLEAPWALHRRYRFHRGDERRRQPQGQHQTTQFALERLEPGHEERTGKAEDSQHRECDDHLLGPVMQDGFQEVTVPPDEFPGDRVVEQPGQVHVQGR